MELADRLWTLLQREFTHRLVLEMDDLPLLRSALLGELIQLHERITAEGGLLRLCGLSNDCRQVLCSSRLSDRFPHYGNRTEAVMGLVPRKPR